MNRDFKSRRIDPELRANARENRKQQTYQENHLWRYYLRDLPYRVHRQKVIGPYIVDFCIPAKKLVIEIDGSQHYTPEGLQEDKNRTLYLNSQGYKVIRFTNEQVFDDFDLVCSRIDSALALR